MGLGAGERRAFYDALEGLLRVYRFRDRDRACYGDVTPNECHALEALARGGALSVNELAGALGLHKSNASRLAEALEARRLLRRQADGEDGRALRVVLTPQGRRAHEAIRARVEALQAELLERYPAEVRRAFVRLLGELTREAAERVGRAERKAEMRAC